MEPRVLDCTGDQAGDRLHQPNVLAGELVWGRRVERQDAERAVVATDDRNREHRLEAGVLELGDELVAGIGERIVGDDSRTAVDAVQPVRPSPERSEKMPIQFR